jgi:hypothetical protein
MNHFDDDECDEDEEEEDQCLRVFCGPYFRCKSLPRIGTKTIKTCVNERCGKYEKEFYDREHVHCHACGCKLETGEVPDPSLRKDSWKLQEVVGRELTTLRSDFRRWWNDESRDVWVAWINDQTKKPREFCLLNPPTMTEILPAQIESEKAWLLYTQARQGYRNLCEVYGSENVTLEWGVLTWES